ncbi:MAG: polysaccharide deacetylase family protein [Bacteroidales bacterium]|nr:polysaccharide deacetylase family protein [Bacteroidales bacterium]
MLTNDVETTSIWFNTLRDETGLKVLNEGMPALLDIYQKNNIKSTFFFTGYIAKLYPSVVKMILPYGHEVGSHALSHEVKDGFDVLSLDKQIIHLSESKKILENISGNEVISFRSPALRVNKYTPTALLETGFKIDSSIASTRFDAFLSFGSKEKLKWLFAPRTPYKTSIDSLFKKGGNGVIEVPLSATFFPYVGTTMRIFSGLTRAQHHLLHFETNRINHKPIVFDIHPNEFIDESMEPRIISKRAKNYPAYLLKDLIRSKLKVKNLGPGAISLYEREIQFFQKRGYEFCTIKEYCKKQKLV